MNLPTTDQVNSVLRHAASYAAGVGTALTALGVLDAQHAAEVVSAFQHIANGLQEVVGGLSTLLPIVGAAIATVSALFAGKSASLKSRLQSLKPYQDTIHVDVMSDAPAQAQEVAADTKIPNVIKVEPFVPVAKALGLALAILAGLAIAGGRAEAQSFDHPRPVWVLGVVLGVPVYIAPAPEQCIFASDAARGNLTWQPCERAKSGT